MSFEVKKDPGTEVRKARLWPLILLFAVAMSMAWALEPVLRQILAP
jgi:hypothetical protein